MLLQGGFVGIIRDRFLATGHGGSDRLDSLRGEDVALVAEELMDVAAHGRGLANRLGKQPAEGDRQRRLGGIG